MLYLPSQNTLLWTKIKHFQITDKLTWNYTSARIIVKHVSLHKNVLQRASTRIFSSLSAYILVPETRLFHPHSQRTQRKNHWERIVASFSFWKHWWVHRFQIRSQSNHEKCWKLDRRFRSFPSPFLPVSVLQRMAFLFFLYTFFSWFRPFSTIYLLQQTTRVFYVWLRSRRVLNSIP